MSVAKLILIALFFVPFLVSAQNQGLPKAGLTPESPFYFLDKLGEAIQEFLTFNPQSKARLQITFAAERVAEITIVLETKGIEAKGLEVAQSRLQANLAKAATIVADQKSKGKDVSSLAKELDDKFEAPKSALAQTFKEQERKLKQQEDELKAQLREAHRAGDTAQEEAIARQLGQVKAQLELLELKEEDIEGELEAEEEKIEEEIEAEEKAEKSIREAEKEKQEILDEATEEDIAVPAEAFGKFDSLLAQAKSSLAAGNFQEARRLAKQAEKSLDAVEDAIEDLEEAKEEKEELKEEQEEQKEKALEAQEKRDEKMIKEVEKDAERLEKEQKKAEEKARKAEEKLREAGQDEEEDED